MASKKGNLSIPWPFENMQVRLNTDTNLLKIVAMVSMLIDHAGKMLFPQYALMRLIGRLAFPIYAYCLTVGCCLHQEHAGLCAAHRAAGADFAATVRGGNGARDRAHVRRQLCRQPRGRRAELLRGELGTPEHPFVAGAGLILLWTIRDRHLILTAAMLLLAWEIQGSLDYGFKGVMLMLLFFLFCRWRLVSLPLVAGFMIWWGLSGSGYQLFELRFSSQMFAVFALPLIYLRTRSGIKLNKWVFYLFYPAHLVLILVLDRLAVFS